MGLQTLDEAPRLGDWEVLKGPPLRVNFENPVNFTNTLALASAGTAILKIWKPFKMLAPRLGEASGFGASARELQKQYVASSLVCFVSTLK